MLELQLIGSPSMLCHGELLRPPSKRTIPILTYLALTPGETPRTRLIELLWHEGRAVNLRQELAKIRKLCDGSTFLRNGVTEGTLSVHCVSDVERLKNHLARENFRPIVDAWLQYGRADLLGRLDLTFLPPSFHDWLALENLELERLFREALLGHAIELEAVGDVGEAIALHHELINLDPLNESAHQAIIRLETARGRPQAALRQFEAVKFVLESELSQPPDQVTIELAAAIPRPTVSGQVASGTSSQQAFVGPRTRFVGRSAELMELETLFALPDCRMVTLVGIGGIGKTRLALEFADRCKGWFTDGVLYVPLAHVAEPAMLAPSLVARLGLPASSEVHAEQVLRHLERRSLLMVLDSFEHLVGAASFVDEVLERSPGSKILVTARRPVGIQAEHKFRVDGMAYMARPAAPLDKVDAIELFMSRIKVRIDEHDLPEVAAICRAVRGMPLAIELASNLADQLSVREIANELEKGNFGVLAAEQRDRPSRHRAVRSVLEGGWSLLSAGDQEALAKLSVFTGTFDQRAAKAITGVGLDGLSRLVDNALLFHDSDGKFGLHETVRWFAKERLLSMAGGDQLKKSLHLIAAQYLQDLTGTKMPASLDELNPLIRAFHHLVAAEKFGDACRLLLNFDVRLLLRWGQAETVLDLHSKVQGQLKNRRLLGRSLNAVGLALGRLGRFPEAITAYEQALEISRATKDVENEANYLGNLGIAYNVTGDLRSAIDCHEEAVAISRRLGDTRSEGIDLGCLGLAYGRLGDLAVAAEYHQLAFEASKAAGDKQSQANHLGNLAHVENRRGQHLAALGHASSALALRRELRDLRGEAVDILCLADVYGNLGRRSESSEQFKAALALNRRIGERIMESETLLKFSKFLSAQGDDDEAMTRAMESLEICRAVGDKHFESEILEFIGVLFMNRAEERAAYVVWLAAYGQLPEKDTGLGGELVEHLRPIRNSKVVDDLLGNGSGLLARTIGRDYLAAFVAALQMVGSRERQLMDNYRAVR